MVRAALRHVGVLLAVVVLMCVAADSASAGVMANLWPTTSYLDKTFGTGSAIVLRPACRG